MHDEVDLTKPLYHVSQKPLTVGSVLEKGNWGASIKSTKIDLSNDLRFFEFFDATQRVLREIILEQGRLIHAPDKPSRLSCIFVLPTLELAKKYREEKLNDGFLYQVKITNPEAKYHLTSYERIAPTTEQHEASFFNAWIETAKDYWSNNHNDGCPEILVESDLEILALMDD